MAELEKGEGSTEVRIKSEGGTASTAMQPNAIQITGWRLVLVLSS